MGTQLSHPFVPPEFRVPEKLETAELRLRMLSVHDAVKDYDAVMSSVEHLKKVFADSDWPEGLTLEDNLIDLAWHQREFTNRSSFAYTVANLPETRVLGCLYINPTRKRAFDAECYFWARKSELESGLDARLSAAVRDWLAKQWPFESVAFPGRDLDWDTWNALPEEKR